MFNLIYKHFTRGIDLARNNPQILYTLFLLIVIPYAFLLSGQRFFDASNENQNRVENESFGLMQDSFVQIASDKLDDPVALNNSVKFFKEKNPSISAFTVVRVGNGTTTIVASLDPEDLGKEDIENKRIVTEQEGILKTQSLLVPTTINGERHFLAYRGIVDSSGKMVAYFITDFSMQWIDDLSAVGVRDAYLFLAFIILGIFVLLIRQARIIDYTILYQRLKEVDQMKDDFVSMAAHELRTPLTIIRGYVDNLRDISGLDEKHKENIETIDHSAKQLNLLIGDILDVSRLEQGRMSFDMKPLDIGALVTELSGLFQVPAKDKGLTLASEVSPSLPMVSADAERMRQVLTNFIGNAVKYTPTGSVKIFATLDDQKKKVSVRISDTGIGISAEDQKKLFQKFSRIRNKDTESISGTGLGLWITEQMVRAMKGTISVESITGKGTDFIVSFPALTS